MKLVIVESPNKVETIKKYLGNDYEVMASVGHITKLSTKGDSGLGIYLTNWEPQFVLDPSKREVVKKLKEAVKKAEKVYIATDPDREGEAIGDHLVKYLKIGDKYSRIKYNEITKEAILKAIDNPGELDEPLIEAQKARRMLDRIIGFKLSQLMKKKMTNSPTNPSAGRVQSIALKLIVDRENEIKAFVPKGYHKLEAKLTDKLSASIYQSNHETGEKDWIYPEELNDVKANIDVEPKHVIKVTDIKESSKKLTTLVPFKQAVLYKRSPYSSRSTQACAQKLYEGYGEGGLISYPRTDSTRLSQHFLDQARAFISKKWGDNYILKEIKGFAGDQDAHEAIRPTNINLSPDMAKKQYPEMSDTEYNVYKLIYEHTLQCLINPPIRSNKQYTFKKEKVELRLTCSKILFDGYYIVKGEKDEIEDPNYRLKQEVNVLEYIITNHETQPKPRYSEGSLIEALDNIKVGRPSTFASTVKIVEDRNYATLENGSLHPTQFGEVVLEKLLKHFPDIINEGYTAEVEAELDLIAEDKTAVQPVMEDFYSKFTKSYLDATTTMEHTTFALTKIDELCPEDHGNLVVRTSKRGEQFVGCENFPKCHFTKSLDNGEGNKKHFFRRRYSKTQK